MNTFKRRILLVTAEILALLDVLLGVIIIGINWLSRLLVKGEGAVRRKAAK